MVLPSPEDWARQSYLSSLRRVQPFPKVDYFKRPEESTYGKHVLEEITASKHIEEAIYKVVEDQVNAIANALEKCASVGIGLEVVHYEPQFRGWNDRITRLKHTATWSSDLLSI